MNDSESRELLVRLLRRCRYEPSIAEIADEWRTMKRCSRAVFAASPRQERQTVSAAAARLIRQAQEAIRQGGRVSGIAVSPELIQFARSFFPGISLATIERNKLELACCMAERQQELDEESPYRTIPVMHRSGDITVCMRRMVQQGENIR